MNAKDYIVIPAYNEATRLDGVLQKIALLGHQHIVVVDDGSSDGTAAVAREHGVKVLRHAINMGAGAATQTGIDYALEQGAEYVLTMDADHQHLPEDIEHLFAAIRKWKCGMVIGSRFLKPENQIPTSRIWYNKVANILTLIIAGVSVTDSQSGMKVLSREFADASSLNCNGFEFCVEMIKNANLGGFEVKEVPINVRYTKETMEKGQNLYRGIKMIGRLIRLNFYR